MIINVKNIDIHYTTKGDKGRCVILLHGWGQNTEMMQFIADFLGAHFRVFNLDMPGFGQSGEPDHAYSVIDYMELVRSFIETLKLDDQPIFIAHSFGCRIALHYAYKYGAYKMCLTGAAGVRDKRGLDYYAKVYSYKLGKKVLSLKPFEKYQDQFMKNRGSEDYQNTSGVMRETFVKVVNDDVTPFLKDMKCETLLVFGSNDDATPVSKGKLMEKLMPNCALVIFENDDHYAYFHQAERFNRVLEAFLKSDYD